MQIKINAGHRIERSETLIGEIEGQSMQHSGDSVIGSRGQRSSSRMKMVPPCGGMTSAVSLKPALPVSGQSRCTIGPPRSARQSMVPPGSSNGSWKGGSDEATLLPGNAPTRPTGDLRSGHQGECAGMTTVLQDRDRRE